MSEVEISNSYIVASGIKKIILDSFGAATVIPNFQLDLDNLVEFLKNDENVKNELDIYELKKNEMLDLGFGYLKDTNYLLIPAWIYQFIPDELAVVKEGESEYKMMKKEDMSKDLLNGCFRYGIYPSDVKHEQLIK